MCPLNFQAFLESIRRSRGYRGQIVHVERIPARKAQYAEIAPPLPREIEETLKRQGITRLYSHQAEAIEAVRRGEHVIVVTSTASGKTLCYNAPVFETLLVNPCARALYIYPTKALAQDQLAKLRLLQEGLFTAPASQEGEESVSYTHKGEHYSLTLAKEGRRKALTKEGVSAIRAYTYDGDTPRQDRPFIKSVSNIVLTNPDMLHVGILPYHTTWSDLFRNLHYVVIDEAHTYRGVFGAHVANIIRRLRRIAEYYGSRPQFVCASATVREPAKLAKDLTGLEARVIENDGSPSGEKTFVFWNPPMLDSKGERRSSNYEAVELFTRLVESGVRTIVFTRARKTAELILRYAKKELREAGSSNVEKIMSYRAGYRPSERRDIERRLFSGELLGVTSTSALEVGVDIGGLDAVVMTGYPGSISSTWQQAGRAGRGVEESLAVLIALNDPIDQYLMRDPNYLFAAEYERAIVDTQNPYILADHLVCASYELPLENEEIDRLFGERAWEVLGTLSEIDRVEYRRRWFWIGGEFPAKSVNIRSASSDSFNIVSVERGGMLLGTVDSVNAFETVHPGAVYLHMGDSYVVTRLDVKERVAYVEQSNVDYYTTPGTLTTVKIESEVQSRVIPAATPTAESLQLPGAKVGFGDVKISSRVTHYWRKQLFTEKPIDRVMLDLPETSLATEAVWIVLPHEITDRLIGRGFDLAGAIHAMEHVTIGILPLFAICDRNDVGGVSHPEHPDTNSLAAIFVYDGYPGGVGLARAAYESIEKVLETALKTVENCGCENGCPGCVQSPKCGNNNQPLDKIGAAFVLRELLRFAHNDEA